jgi:hypothetical protein
MPPQDDDDTGELRGIRAANDTTPLVSLVRDDQYSRGKVTSQGRTASLAYQQFLERNRARRDGRVNEDR